MIAALDVQYDEATALVAAVAFEDWPDAKPTLWWTTRVSGIEPYVPGQFYKRELPCLQAVLAMAPCDIDLVVVDGHVWLDNGQPGLGHHLHMALLKQVPIIGVAKRRYNKGQAAEVLRGDSEKPLFVTAIGMHESVAVAHIQSMHGPYRIPTLLKRVDALARGR